MITTTKLLRLLKFNFARKIKSTTINVDLTPPLALQTQ
jgi:hypothetical protein